ncbi:MAG: MFS transporter [Desulfovibrionaceae bacterium CG1_02_65_16]|nr:MAG: MFS transporter [Desulfovibrionaceae bacterium CG1_02_65_16]
MNTTTELTAGAAIAADTSTGGRFKNNYFDGLAVTGIHKVVFFLIMLAYFFEQLDNWNFGYIAPALMKSWNLSMPQIGHINFFYFICMTAGGIVGGIVSDFIGRRKTFLIAITIFSLSSMANGWTDNFTIFVIARGMTGFGVFCLMVCSQAYIAEMAPAETRGKWQGLVASVGFCAVPVIGILCRVIIPLSDEAWRYIFYFGGIGLLALPVAYKFLLESPRWLVSRKRLAEAESVVKHITGQDIDLSEAAKVCVPRDKVWDVMTGMFQRQYIGRTLVLMALFVFTTPACFTVTVWTGTLLHAKGFSITDSLMATTIIQVGVPVGCYIASLVSDMGGRKIPIIIISVLCGAIGFIFGHLDGYWPLIIAGFLMTAGVMGSGFMGFSYCAESYPTRMRNTATGLHNGLARLSVAVAQPLIPMIFATYSFTGVFNAFGVMMILPMIVIAVWGMRTGGKSLESIC